MPDRRLSPAERVRNALQNIAFGDVLVLSMPGHRFPAIVAKGDRPQRVIQAWVRCESNVGPLDVFVDAGGQRGR